MHLLALIFPAIGRFLSYDGLICIGTVALIAFLLTRVRGARGQCPRCRTINREGAVYCAQCGMRLPHR